MTTNGQLPTTMPAAVWTGADTLDVQTVPVPHVPAGWALVRTEYTGLCGTDFSILHGTHPRAAAPLILGHEITGVVEVAAPGGPEPGTRVVVEPLIACGHCHPCRHGNPHVCQDLRLYGIDRPGSLAEFVALPAETLVPVADSVPARQVALAEPLAVAVHAVNRSPLVGGETVVVFGAGPIGLLTALVARHESADRVLVAEPSPARRELAERLGFDTIDAADPLPAVLAATGGAGADIAFDSAGHPAVAAVIADTVRVHGTIMIVGVYKRPAAMDLQRINFAELTVVGSRVYTRADLERSVALIEDGVLGLDRLPVAVHGLANVDAAFTEAMSAGEAVKVLVTPQQQVPAGPTHRTVVIDHV